MPKLRSIALEKLTPSPNHTIIEPPSIARGTYIAIGSSVFFIFMLERYYKYWLSGIALNALSINAFSITDKIIEVSEHNRVSPVRIFI